MIPLLIKRASILLSCLVILGMTGCASDETKTIEVSLLTSNSSIVQTEFETMTPPIAVKYIRSVMRPSMIQEDLVRLFGNKYKEFQIHSGNNTETLWRYDIGVKEGFNPTETREFHDWADETGIKKGSVYAQFLIRWIDGKSESFWLAYRGADNESKFEEVTGEFQGITWEMAPKEPPAVFHADIFGYSDMNDFNNGWAAGRKVWKTSDGGITWVDRTPPKEDGSYELLRFADPNTLMAFFRPKEFTEEMTRNTDLSLSEEPVYRTTDGGDNWEQLEHPLKGHWGIHPMVTMGEAQFVDEHVGYYYAYAEPGMAKERRNLFLKTIDGGRHWTVLSEDITNQRDLGYASPNGLVIRNHNEPWITYNNTGKGNPIIFKSTTNGHSWEQVKMEVPMQAVDTTTYPLTKPMFWGPHDTSGLMPFSFYKDNNLNGVIWYKTTDGGMSWTSRVSTYESITAKPTSAGRNNGSFSVYAYDINNLWILENNLGELYRSQDGGESWQNVGSSPSFQNVTSLIFSSPTEGRAYSRFINLYTKDGGATWKEQH
ncbi:hypothetical protein [Paenibacillus qinlingensis]|uniref:Photosystem II stability/assembly factor-like uncharacterized protein n=1 Tax=Paenibacillus qinlingensis TaxID=1837343 RepID=A0ABU1NP15_9BACL|nr:hypothetical protein [Paenibacillus qinlingensis]MDR6549148.1 photosystem II stability/assembly factor-like uncharacterized protein [Paenibacillus qinlingensis]